MGSSSERKAQFRQYLESSGVMDAIVKSLVELYHLEEKPDNPLEFVRKQLGGGAMETSESSCEEKDKMIEQLNKTVEEMKAKLDNTNGAHQGAEHTEAEEEKVKQENASLVNIDGGLKEEGEVVSKEKVENETVEKVEEPNEASKEPEANTEGETSKEETEPAKN